MVLLLFCDYDDILAYRLSFLTVHYFAVNRFSIPNILGFGRGQSRDSKLRKTTGSPYQQLLHILVEFGASAQTIHVLVYTTQDIMTIWFSYGAILKMHE